MKKIIIATALALPIILICAATGLGVVETTVIAGSATIMTGVL